MQVSYERCVAFSILRDASTYPSCFAGSAVRWGLSWGVVSQYISVAHMCYTHIIKRLMFSVGTDVAVQLSFVEGHESCVRHRTDCLHKG